MPASRSRLLRPLFVVVLTAIAIVGVTQLVGRLDTSRRAQIGVGRLTQTVSRLGSEPFSADPAFSPRPDAHSPLLAAHVAAEMRAEETTLARGLTAASRAGAPGGLIAEGRRRLARVRAAASRVFAVATGPGGLKASGPAEAPALQKHLEGGIDRFLLVLGQLDRAEAHKAARARSQAETGAVAALLFLLAVFGFFYVRSERLARRNTELLSRSRVEASTDALTGLGNRRALTAELSSVLRDGASGGPELLLAVFDLDGFKQYNDTFGHAAGDALLTRLGGRLSEVCAAAGGSAYRMGGDEFCVLARCAPASAEGRLEGMLAALTDTGEGWRISSSHGAVWVPSEAASSGAALQLADERMYANKVGRVSAGRQIADALLQVLGEQDNGLEVHGGRVAELSGEVASALHQSGGEVQRIRLAAALHDIGKTAIPESVLNKPGPLDAHEWAFMHRHTLIGERIVLAASAVADTAPLIRSSHERLDGTGYPEGLAGEEIPIGSRIIAACDAFDAMTSERPYRETRSVADALAELRACAGSQFDPAVVAAVCDVVLARGRVPAVV